MRQGDSRTAGFSLVEVLVSLSIFSIAGVAFASSIMTNQGFNRLSSERTGAQFAVEQIVDDLRVQDPTTLPAHGTDAVRHVTIGTKTYDVYVTYCSLGSYCSSSATVRTIHCEARLKGVTRYVVDTVFAQLK